jgi:hypothetical protein
LLCLRKRQKPPSDNQILHTVPRLTYKSSAAFFSLRESSYPVEIGVYWARGPPLPSFTLTPIWMKEGSTMKKEYYITLNGERIPVSEEIYRAYRQPAWSEQLI